MDERLAQVNQARFATATLGYVPTQVQRLLSDLRTAIGEGTDLGPIIGARQLDDASFGYDKSQVDALLNQLLVADAPPSTAPAAEVDPCEVTEAAGPVGDTTALQEAVRAVRFRMARRGETGYDVVDVDATLDKVDVALQRGESLEFLRTIRFPLAGRFEAGYQVGDVDDFIDAVADGHVPPAVRVEEPPDGAGRRLLRWLGLAPR